LFFFFIQLILNALWSVAFFGVRSPLLGLFDIVLLWIAILLTMISFFGISKAAALLLLPYILWVSFAVLLNFSLWILNS
jgi:benzodiazapine receptor